MKAREWNRVSDCLPLVGEQVLVRDIDGYYRVGRLKSLHKFPPYFHCGEEVYELEEITHWMNFEKLKEDKK